MIRPGEDAPKIDTHLFLQAEFTTSLAGLMGTLEDPELAAGTTNSLRGTGVITATKGSTYLFLQLLFFSQGLGRSSDALSTNL